MGKSLKNFLNPVGKSNPLRPDNFMKNSVALAKNPFSKVAQHRSYGDYDYEKQLDAEKAAEAANSTALASGIGQIGAESLAAQQALAGPQYALENQYRSQYANLAGNLTGQALLGSAYTPTTAATGPSSNPNPVHTSEYNRVKGLGDTRTYDQWWSDHASANNVPLEEGYVTTPGSAGTSGTGMVGVIDQAATSLQGTQNSIDTAARASGLADIKNLGAGYYDAWRGANPQLAGLQDQLYSNATSGSPLLQTMKSQALEDLQKGGQLGADELRDVQQSVRSAYGSRGLSGSSAAAMAEALNRTRYSDARRAAAQQNALTVDNYSAGLTNQATNTIYNTGFNPKTILDQTGNGLTAAIGTYGLASNEANGAGPTLFNPYSPEIMSYYSGESANDTAKSAAKSSNTASYISAGAGIAGAAIIAL